METRRLSYFVRIAEDGSLTRAAGLLRIAQPALSRQIRLLEEDLGISLFSRTKRGMQLTEEGEHLYASVAGPLRELDRALLNFRSFSSGIVGTITIGMPPNIGSIIAKPFLDRMGVELPNLKLRLVEAYSGSLTDWLNRGLVDFALLEGASYDGRLSKRQVFSERLMLIGAAATNLSPDESITFRDVARLPLIVPCQPYGLRGVLNDAAAKARTILNVRLEADSTELVKQLVESGVGYAAVPLSYVDLKSSNGKLKFCQIIKPEVSVSITLAWRNYRLEPNNMFMGIDRIISKIVSDIFNNS